MQLVEGFFFRKYGDIVYCRNTVTHEDYLFNAFAEDFFFYLQSNPDCEFEQLCEYLMGEYQVDEKESFLSDMMEFSEELRKAGILVEKKVVSESEGLREKAISEAKSSGRLFSAVLEITYRCNERCIHCYVDDDIERNKELTLDEYKRILDSLAELGCANVLLTGGEVCLRSDLLSITEYAIQKGIFVDIYTNGLALEMDTLLRLSELKVNSVSFSLYGATPAVHDRITCVPGSFSKTINSILMCKAFGIDTYIKSVAMKQNFHEIEDLFRLGKKFQVPIAVSTRISSSHKGKCADEYRLLDAEKYQVVSRAILNNDPLTDEEIEQLSVGREPQICRIGRNSISIDPYGAVFPCNALQFPLGNVRDQALTEIYKSCTFFDRIEKLKYSDVCENIPKCPDSGWCSFCLGNSYAEHHSWHPTPEVCLAARGSHLACLALKKEVNGNEREY